MPPLVLASASSARRRLLLSVGLNPIVQASHFDESSLHFDSTQALVEGLALAKAQTVAPQFPQALVLGCDSLLLLDGEAQGKPTSPQEALTRWQQMRGRWGELYTGHALMDVAEGKTLLATGLTRVHFADVEDQTLEAYVKTGEPLNCAGAFSLEGRGGLLIERIEGCYSNVIGLSLPLLRQLLTRLGYSPEQFW